MEALKALRNGRPIRAIGLMSGTSLDGVDAALIETDGVDHVVSLGEASIPYDDHARSTLKTAVDCALSWNEKREDAPEILAAAAVLTKWHAKAIQALGAEDAALIGFHGQTLLHRPDMGFTWQLGDGGALADAVDMPVIYDFRHNDVAAGGQGAPFAPLYHAALAKRSGLGGDVAILNLGGVANLTFLGDDIAAFDTGPANGLLDEWAVLHGLGAFDEGGKLALAGQVSEQALGCLMQNSYFQQPFPKSLDRYDFSLKAVEGLSIEDGAATLTAFTAATIALALRQANRDVSTLAVGGGGAQNPALMRAIEMATACTVMSVDHLGWHSDALEAECFAYLAARSVRGLPLSLPGTTGVNTPQTGGRLALPKDW